MAFCDTGMGSKYLGKVFSAQIKIFDDHKKIEKSGSKAKNGSMKLNEA